MHQFVLDNVEFILGVIVIAQGTILYRQNKIYEWNKSVLTNILVFMIAARDTLVKHEQKLK